MDIDDLLRMKAETISQSIADAILDGADVLLFEEIAKGETANPQRIVELSRKVSAALFPKRNEQIAAQFADAAAKRALCVVDFATVPYSFNILVNLFVAEKFRQDRDCDVLDIVFVAHASDPGIRNQPHFTDLSLKRRFRTLVHNMGIAATRLLPSVGSIFFFDNRALFANFFDSIRSSYQIFPMYYHPRYPLTRISHDDADSFCFIHLTHGRQPTDVLRLTPPTDEMDMARRWLRKSVYPAVPVTLTLRNLGFDSQRNSDIEAWRRILARVRDPRIRFVIVPDYYDVFGPEDIDLPNVVYCHEAALTVPLRAAFYAQSSFNIFGNNGPLAIGYLSQTINYLIFMDATRNGSGVASEIAVGEGIFTGSQFWGANEFQRNVWETRDENVIVNAIEDMISDLDRAGHLAPAWYAEAG